MNKSIQLVVYASTPIYIAFLLNLIPEIGWIGLVAGVIYSLYLFFLGIPVLKKTPEDKVPIYLVVIVLALIIVDLILQKILGRIFFSFYLDGMSPLLH